MPDEHQGANPLSPSRAAAAFGGDSRLPAAPRQAVPPAAPALPPSLQKAALEQEGRLKNREVVERRSMLRGLILLALIALLVSLARAGVHRAFPAGWWR